jgi:pantoate--beta-alanine ligase
MKIINSPKAMYKMATSARRRASAIGFVPTMGALHEGHLSLIRRARRDNDFVVVSIFVNPSQFGKGEDFAKYPRPRKRDIAFCRKERADVLFCPGQGQIYPQGYKTYVNVEGLSGVLCGESRPGHFRGVATVVAKLLNIVRPDTLYLGRKDAQQAIIIAKMVRDLDFPAKVKVMPTIREKSGLALSSRNAYLNRKEREDARVIPKSLKLAALLIKGGQRDAGTIIRRMREIIGKKKNIKIEYISIADNSSLEPLKKVKHGCMIAMAVRIGRTRLIDNITVTT